MNSKFDFKVRSRAHLNHSAWEITDHKRTVNDQADCLLTAVLRRCINCTCAGARAEQTHWECVAMGIADIMLCGLKVPLDEINVAYNSRGLKMLRFYRSREYSENFMPAMISCFTVSMNMFGN